MPDWSYAPFFRPLLFRLPAEQARALTLRMIGGLGRRPGGAALIAALGHMEPPGELRRSIAGLDIRSPIGLGAGLDVDGFAAPALSRFELGHLELGPVTLQPVVAEGAIERREREEAIVYPGLPVNPGLAVLLRNLTTAGRLRVPVGVKLAHRPGADAAEAAEERRELVAALASHVDFFTLDSRAPASGAWSGDAWVAHLDALLGEGGATMPVFLCLAPDVAPEVADALIAPALERGMAGVVVTGGVAAEGNRRLVGAPTRGRVRGFVRGLRERYGEDLVIFAGGGVQQPADALALLDAGADVVQLHSGLVYNGPGLAKRTNEALLKYERRSTKYELSLSKGMTFPTERKGMGGILRPSSFVRHPSAWLGFLCLGIGMVISGSLAWVVAVRRVILPYDEYFVRMSREELTAKNARLLSFMAHDRISLASAMIAIGVLYAALAWGGVRKGHHWAWAAMVASSGVGFLSFFLFLGFGYFDPLHAMVSAILFPFWLIGVFWAQPRGAGDYGPPEAGLRNTRAWRLSLVGQLCFVMLGVGLLVGGLTIAGTGVTQVFVPSDLAFMRTEGPFLREISPRLVPLVAHDRAGYGGTIATTGAAVLFAGLWGIRPGARWLWWGLLLSGLPGMVGAIGVHYAVGYTDFLHLSPVWLALFLYVMGLGLTYRSSMEGWTSPRRLRAAPLSPEERGSIA